MDETESCHGRFYIGVPAQALPLRRAAGDRRGEAQTLNNISDVYEEEQGKNQKALDYHNQALPLLRAAGDRRGEAQTLNNIGRVYEKLGEKEKALEYHKQADEATGRAAGLSR